VFEGDGAGVGEAGCCEELEPGGAGEEALDVAVLLDVDGAVRLAEEVGEVHGVGGIGRVGVPRPLQVAEAAPVRPVMAAVVC